MAIRFAFLSLAAALATASPAAAQDDEFTLEVVTGGAVLAICPDVLDHKTDLNDTARLGEWHLFPASAGEEADMRRDLPGIELAKGALPTGSLMLGATPDTCSVQIKGEGRIAARDALIKSMRDMGAKMEQAPAADGGLLTFPFLHHTIYVATNANDVMVQVR